MRQLNIALHATLYFQGRQTHKPGLQSGVGLLLVSSLILALQAHAIFGCMTNVEVWSLFSHVGGKDVGALGLRTARRAKVPSNVTHKYLARRGRLSYTLSIGHVVG